MKLVVISSASQSFHLPLSQSAELKSNPFFAFHPTIQAYIRHLHKRHPLLSYTVTARVFLPLKKSYTDIHSSRSNQMAKEILAGFAGAEADRLIETKGEDFYDREKFRHHAKQQAEHLYDQRMGGERDGRY